VSQHDTSAHEFVAFIEGQARRFADPDRRRIDDATLRVQDFLRGCELDPHDTTVIRTVHAVLQLLADEAGRQVATRHLPPNDALVHAAGELWEAVQDMWENQKIADEALAMVRPHDTPDESASSA